VNCTSTAAAAAAVAARWRRWCSASAGCGSHNLELAAAAAAGAIGSGGCAATISTAAAAGCGGAIGCDKVNLLFFAAAASASADAAANASFVDPNPTNCLNLFFQDKLDGSGCGKFCVSVSGWTLVVLFFFIIIWPRRLGCERGCITGNGGGVMVCCVPVKTIGDDRDIVLDEDLDDPCAAALDMDEDLDRDDDGNGDGGGGVVVKMLSDGTGGDASSGDGDDENSCCGGDASSGDGDDENSCCGGDVRGDASSANGDGDCDGDAFWDDTDDFCATAGAAAAAPTSWLRAFSHSFISHAFDGVFLLEISPNRFLNLLGDLLGCDWRTLAVLFVPNNLSIKPGDECCCVTGAGDEVVIGCIFVETAAAAAAAACGDVRDDASSANGGAWFRSFLITPDCSFKYINFPSGS
jgi:hypothetical protein